MKLPLVAVWLYIWFTDAQIIWEEIFQWLKWWSRNDDDGASLDEWGGRKGAEKGRRGWGGWGLVRLVKVQHKRRHAAQLFSAAHLLWERRGREENGNTHLLAYSCQDRWRPFWPDLWAGTWGEQMKGVGAGEERECDKSKQQISKEPPCACRPTQSHA